MEQLSDDQLDVFIWHLASAVYSRLDPRSLKASDLGKLALQMMKEANVTPAGARTYEDVCRALILSISNRLVPLVKASLKLQAMQIAVRKKKYEATEEQLYVVQAIGLSLQSLLKGHGKDVPLTPGITIMLIGEPAESGRRPVRKSKDLVRNAEMKCSDNLETCQSIKKKIQEQVDSLQLAKPEGNAPLNMVVNINNIMVPIVFTKGRWLFECDDCNIADYLRTATDDEMQTEASSQMPVKQIQPEVSTIEEDQETDESEADNESTEVINGAGTIYEKQAQGEVEEQAQDEEEEQAQDEVEEQAQDEEPEKEEEQAHDGEAEKDKEEQRHNQEQEAKRVKRELRLSKSRKYYNRLIKYFEPDATVGDILFHFKNPHLLLEHVQCREDIPPNSQIDRYVQRAYKVLKKYNDGV